MKGQVPGGAYLPEVKRQSESHGAETTRVCSQSTREEGAALEIYLPCVSQHVVRRPPEAGKRAIPKEQGTPHTELSEDGESFVFPTRGTCNILNKIFPDGI